MQTKLLHAGDKILTTGLSACVHDGIQRRQVPSSPSS